MGKLEFLEAVATMVGTVVGAGIFGIPYVVSQAGFLTGLLDLLVIGIIVLLLYLYLGEVVLRTNGKHQLTGYAEKYLGKWGKRLMLFSMIFGIYGALTAYLLGASSALAGILGGVQLMYMFLFFMLVSGLVYYGLEAIEKSELFTMFLIFIVVILIALFTYPHVKLSNLGSFDVTKFFVPYGVILFAYLGMVAIPEMSEILHKEKKKIKNAILTGMIIPVVIYILFTLIVVGSVGFENFSSLKPDQRIATIALGMVVNPSLFIVANLFAVFAMFTSFLALGLALQEMFIYDYNFKKKAAWAFTCIVPFALALSGLTTFIYMINLSGIVAGGIDAVLIVLMFHKAKKSGDRKPEYEIRKSTILSVIIISFFVIGALFYFFDLLKNLF